MFDFLFEKTPEQFAYLLRYFGYFYLCSMVAVLVITEPNFSLWSLLYIPFAAFILLIEYIFYQKIIHIYKKQVLSDLLFVVDAFLISLAIITIHFLAIPSMIALIILIFRASVRGISKLAAIFSLLIGMVIFYCGIVLIRHVDLVHQSIIHQENIIIMIIFMMFYLFLALNYRIHFSINIKNEQKKLEKELNHYLKLNHQLARYLPIQLWQAIMQGQNEAKVEYTRRKVTVFFSDIQGFSELSERLIPDDLAFILNEYLEHMTEIAKQHGAIIDKFMGDGILMFFDKSQPKHAQNQYKANNYILDDAVACLDMAITMRQQMRILRERWLKMGYPALHIRMGISTGDCHIGNYGSIHRMSYTIIGRDVNLAARLQAAAKVDHILIGESTFNLVKEYFLCTLYKPLKLKGFTDFVKTWQVVERYQDAETYRRWYDYEYHGFNLLLNVDDSMNYEYPQLIDAMKKIIIRLELQQQLTDEEGAVILKKSDVAPSQLNKNYK